MSENQSIIDESDSSPNNRKQKYKLLINEPENFSAEKRQNTKIIILACVLFSSLVCFLIISGVFAYFHSKGESLESDVMLVMVTVLGSTITTIIGILGGTSIN